MGKHDFLTPKAIANRIKAKGLQKLRWYCQLCQKQCRDENGFQCHIKSESHRRQMEIFGQNAGRIVHGYSEEFEHDFMTLLKRGHPFSRVRANTVYNEYIKDRDHVHMNSTRWYTLTGFVQYLGKSGKCIVDQDEEGNWWVTLNQEDPFESISKGKKRSREEKEGEDEIRNQKLLKKQIELAATQNTQNDDQNEEVQSDHELKEDELLNGPIQISLGKKSEENTHQPKNLSRDDQGDDDPHDDKIQSELTKSLASQKKSSTLDRLMKNDKIMQQSKYKNTKNSSQNSVQQIDNHTSNEQPWLFENIIVKIKSESLKKQGFYGKKGVVKQIIDGYVAEIQILDNGSRVRVDQAELETVIPGFGGQVMIVGGTMRGKFGKLVSIKEDQFKAEVEVVKAAEKSQLFDYEEICKVLQ
eukprot:TRINITY_DN3558_c3_g1_i2.p1 TRINITY_DN3558_c3_g1~~TRINITY_DN3558_c3_g1_i2.p1  ORF type:complete len:413 (+),score=61.25 TRINITY_DN3558_c3_g1_i2:60-1298(+)